MQRPDGSIFGCLVSAVVAAVLGVALILRLYVLYPC